MSSRYGSIISGWEQIYHAKTVSPRLWRCSLTVTLSLLFLRQFDLVKQQCFARYSTQIWCNSTEDISDFGWLLMKSVVTDIRLPLLHKAATATYFNVTEVASHQCEPSHTDKSNHLKTTTCRPCCQFEIIHVYTIFSPIVLAVTL